MAHFLKYVGPHAQIEVLNYGHFGPGDEKQVDEVTAGAFNDPRCAEEGWEVRSDEPAQASDATGHNDTPILLDSLHIVDSPQPPAGTITK